MKVLYGLWFLIVAYRAADEQRKPRADNAAACGVADAILRAHAARRDLQVASISSVYVYDWVSVSGGRREGGGGRRREPSGNGRSARDVRHRVGPVSPEGARGTRLSGGHLGAQHSGHQMSRKGTLLSHSMNFSYRLDATVLV